VTAKSTARPNTVQIRLRKSSVKTIEDKTGLKLPQKLLDRVPFETSEVWPEAAIRRIESDALLIKPK
jgi:hypothetical protein